MTVLLAIGTEKGLFLATAVDDRKSWEVSGPHYPMTGVYSVAIDKRGDRPRLLAGMAASHWGPSLVTSDDLGQSWHEPDHAPLAFPERTEKALERVWQIAPGPADQPDRVYAGTQPSALFVSDDGGRTYAFVDGLWGDPDRLYAQNHHGVYRSDDAGASWQSIADGLPTDFGFAMIAHPHRSGVIYNFPIEADSKRFAPELRCRVYRSEDAGVTWAPLSDGLPDEPFYPTVLRDAMCADDADPAGIYFGTRSGEGYASRDEGESWHQVAAHLPDILSVRAALV